MLAARHGLRRCNYDSVVTYSQAPPPSGNGTVVTSGNGTASDEAQGAGVVRYDCTPTQIRTNCLRQQELSAEDLGEAPGDPVPIAMAMQLGAGRLSINGDINQVRARRRPRARPSSAWPSARCAVGG